MKFKNIIKNIIKESQDIGISVDDVYKMIDYYDNYIDLYPGYSNDENDNGEDYFFRSEKDAYEYVDNLIYQFNSLPNPITVYRSVYLKSVDQLRTGEDLGESWSYMKESALEFGTHAGCNYLLSGVIDKKYIAWEDSVKLHFQFSMDGDSESEHEVVVYYPENIHNLKVDKIK